MRSRRSLFLLLLSAIAIFFFAAIPFAQSKLDSELPTQGESGKEKLRPWPCCDRCGVCTKSIPPLCTCMDKVRSCHPACKNCVRSPLSSNPPLYQCMDIIVNYCKNKCSSDVKTFEQY